MYNILVTVGYGGNRCFRDFCSVAIDIVSDGSFVAASVFPRNHDSCITLSLGRDVYGSRRDRCARYGVADGYDLFFGSRQSRYTQRRLIGITYNAVASIEVYGDSILLAAFQ